MARHEDRFPATDRKILRRLDEAAARQVGLGILATLFSFVVIVWIGDLWRHWPRLTVLFGGGILLGAVLQAVLILFFETLYPRGPQRWRRRFSVVLILRAAIWSAFVVALLEAEGAGQLFFLAMFLPLTLGAALAATWLADLWTVRLYLVVTLVPPMLRLLIDFRPDTLLVAAFLAAFLYALIRVADHHRHLFWRALARRDTDSAPLPIVDGVHARLLVRAAEEMRRPVAVVSDTLAVGEQGERPELRQAARRAALQLVDRLEVMDDAARLLRGERVPVPEAGTLRRRCEEVADDIGIVAAEGGVLCTTQYDAELPERLRLDYVLLFRGLRAVAVWVLEQMPPGGEMVLRFQLAPGQHEDRLRCAIDVRTLYLPDPLRNGLDRTAQGSGIVDPDVPLPLAVAGEIGRLLGGSLSLIGQAPDVALALEARLDVVEQPERDNELRGPLRGRTLLLVGGSDAQAAALDTELRSLDMRLARCEAGEDVVAAATAQDALLVLLAARDIQALAPVLRAFRDARSVRRIAVLAPGSEAPALPDGVSRPAPEWLRLPLGRRRLRAALARAAGVDEPPQSPSPQEIPLRVLVVEDNPVNQLVARGMLEKLGCEVEILSDGALAVDRLQRGGIDLVLMDCEMPGMDGSEATRRIRAREAEQGLPRLPVVAMTAHSGDSDVAGFLAAGMDDCIPKPVSLASLASRIERFRLRR
ncbi:MAG: response regulator [Pseudomonadota bacterium]